MKKIALICLCGLAAASIMTGCSSSTTDGKEKLGTVELAEYRGVAVNIPVVEASDDEVQVVVNQDLRNNPKEIEVDRPAAEGDVVNIDYVGKQDGVEFAGGSGKGFDLTLGSGSFIPGFEDGLIGTKKGEKKNLNLTFPADYNQESLAGQAVVFEVTVNAVKEQQEAVLDNEFVQSISDYRTVDEYKEGIREDLLKDRQQAADLQVQQSALQKVVEGSKFKLSKNAVSKRYNARVKQYTEQAKMYGTSLAGMAQANGMDEPGLKQVIYASVEDDVKNQLVINTIAEKEGITLEDADRQAFVEQNGQTVEEAVSLYGQETVDEMTLNYKVMKFLADNAVNETDGSAAVESTAAGEATDTGTAGETTAEETKSGEAGESKAGEATAEETKAGAAGESTTAETKAGAAGETTAAGAESKEAAEGTTAAETAAQ